MDITPIAQGFAVSPTTNGMKTALSAATSRGGSGIDFGQALGKALDQLSALEAGANDAAVRLAAGEEIDLHEAVLALEKANLGFQLALQTRNKLVEAYQEVMRMQV